MAKISSNLLFRHQFVKIKLKHYFWRKNTKIMIKLTNFDRRQSPPCPTSLADLLHTTKNVAALEAKILRTAQNAGHLEVCL